MAAPEAPNAAQAAPSDAEVLSALRARLASADLATTTEKRLRLALEAHFGVALKDRKALIKEEVLRFIQAKDAEGAQEPAKEEEVANEGGTRSWSRGSKGAKGGGGKKRKAVDDGDKPKKAPARGLTAPCVLSPELAAVVGTAEMPRTQVVKAIWAYVKEHDLRNPKDKREFIMDEKLGKVFPVKKTNMFKMNKYLSKHVKTKADLVDY